MSNQSVLMLYINCLETAPNGKQLRPVHYIYFTVIGRMRRYAATWADVVVFAVHGLVRHSHRSASSL